MPGISIITGIAISKSTVSSDIAVDNNIELETGENFLLETGNYALLES